MEITKTKNGKRYMIQVDDILFFTLAVAFGTLIYTGILKILGLI